MVPCAMDKASRRKKTAVDPENCLIRHAKNTWIGNEVLDDS